jgi:pSer/pThr/pTyr-binding forkhead associated (FHA) protein
MEILLSIQSKTDGTVREEKYDIGSGLVIGRGAEQGVLLEGLDLSREHLVLTADGTHIYVEDLSVNGTWLNGKRLRKSVKTRVRADDSIGLPGYSLTFRLVDQSDETPADSIPPVSPVISDHIPTEVLAANKSGPLAALDPVFRFISSFSFMEKFLVLVGLTGLLLLYTYVSS